MTTTFTESLSYSRAYTFNKCRTLYDFKYIQKIKILPKDMHVDSWERMFRGTCIHGACEAAFLKQDPVAFVKQIVVDERAKGLSPDQLALLDEIESDSLSVAADFLEWLPVTDWEPVMVQGKPLVEVELRLPIAGWPGGFVGYADLIARHIPTGRVFCLDWKSKARFTSEGDWFFSIQDSLYRKVLKEQLGVDCVGSAYCEIKPVPPKRAPRNLRVDAGGVSGVRESSDGRFRFTPLSRSVGYLDNVWEDFQRQAVVMSRFTSQDAYTNQSAFSCRGCEYLTLCQGRLGNHDVQGILDTGYSYNKDSLKIVMEE